MNPSYDQLNDYTHYLESQVEKFTAFMLTQKKLNQKHLHFELSLEQILQKITQMSQKITVFELNQQDNLYEIKKVRTQKQALKTMELRLENIQRELSSILNIESNNSLDIASSRSSFQKKPSKQKNIKREQPPLNSQDKDMTCFQKYFQETFVKRQELESTVRRTKDELEFRIKKIQIQIDKSKESFLKLTNHISTLSANLSLQNTNKKQSRQDNRLYTQSTKDQNIQSMNQQNMVTKKELRKMQKKLENFFSQKFSQMTSKNQKNQTQSEGLTAEKVMKFKRIQQKYERMNLEHSNPRETKSERKIDLSDKPRSSHKKVPLFDNEILKERHLNFITQNDSKKRGTKSKSNKESPIALFNLAKQKKGHNSRSRTKKIGKKRSPERIKKIHFDYMME